MSKQASIVRLFAGFAIIATSSFASVVDIGPTKDNTLYESNTGALSNGSGVYLFSGRTAAIGGQLVRRALLAFDVAANVPANATIQSVTLTLHLSKTHVLAPSTATGLHRADADWGEGTSNAFAGEGQGATATMSDATWIHAINPSSNWATPGGDFNATASATQTVGAAGLFYTWGSTPGMVADVQSWLTSPATNFGWFVIGDESVGRTAKRFDSRESATASFRPVLSIEFTTPCNQDSDCDDLLFCTGVETCVANVCTPGSDPCPGQFCNENQNACTDCVDSADCNDNIACTNDACVAGNCVFTPDNALCPDNGAYCDGPEICDAALDCISAGDPCGLTAICNETTDVCDDLPIRIELQVVAGGGAAPNTLVSPVSLTHAGDGSGRLFVVDQIGQIRIIENGVLLATPFLDVSAKLPPPNAFFDERGLLGLTFHPNYATNGRFFIRYSAPRAGDPLEPCNDPGGFVVGCHSEILAEYSVSASDPNLADPASETILFSVDEPQFNHDAGAIAFGPGGLLYWTLGDGGGANDGLADVPPSHGATGNGQNTQTPLGSILRIDVDSPPQPPLPYAIPPGNPFADGVNGLPEIYAYGLRNPYQFSFDDGPGGNYALYVADVGQNLYEEIDLVTNGGNYGWVVREGRHCFDPFAPAIPPDICASTGPFGEPLIDPIVEYIHPIPCAGDPECAPLGVTCGTNGMCGDEGGISVIGGYVYRGAASPLLQGRYLFGDFSDSFGTPGGRLFYFDTTGPNQYQRTEFFIIPSGTPFIGHFLKGMGEGEDGEIYALASDVLGPTGTSGLVLHIVPAPCISNSECTDRDVCTFDQCVSETCVHSPNTYGDVDHNTTVNLFDLFCILDGFSGSFTNCTFEDSDVEPCAGNGTLNLFDLFAVLDSFSGIDPCCSTMP